MIKGLPQLLTRMDAIKPNRDLMARLALSAVREQKILVPRKTGNLGRSIRIGAVTANRAETIATANYAAFVERGTARHDITPKNKKALRFGVGGTNRLSGTPRSGSKPAKGGSTGIVFAKRVRHPGTKAQPYMVPGAKKAVEGAGLKTIVITAWNEAA